MIRYGLVWSQQTSSKKKIKTEPKKKWSIIKPVEILTDWARHSRAFIPLYHNLLTEWPILEILNQSFYFFITDSARQLKQLFNCFITYWQNDLYLQVIPNQSFYFFHNWLCKVSRVFITLFHILLTEWPVQDNLKPVILLFHKKTFQSSWILFHNRLHRITSARRSTAACRSCSRFQSSPWSCTSKAPGSRRSSVTITLTVSTAGAELSLRWQYFNRAGFEPGPSGIWCDRAVNCATTQKLIFCF